MNQFDIDVDARGKSDPHPILDLRKALDIAEGGQIVKLLATDPGSTSDVMAFCRQTGHTLLSSWEQSGQQAFLVQKKS